MSKKQLKKIRQDKFYSYWINKNINEYNNIQKISMIKYVRKSININLLIKDLHSNKSIKFLNSRNKDKFSRSMIEIIENLIKSKKYFNLIILANNYNNKE